MLEEGKPYSEMPSSMKDIVFKQLMNLTLTLKKENNAGYKVMLFTSYGTILGNIEPCTPENEMIKYTDNPEEFELDISSIFAVLEREYKSADKALFYSDAYMLNITDAIIYKNGTQEEFMRLDQMIVFIDQIIGFSLVRTDHNSNSFGNN